jgi:hypothetical protein
MFFLTILYKNNDTNCSSMIFFCSRAKLFPVPTCINKTGYIQIIVFSLITSFFLHIYMEATKERASPFRFRFRVKPVIIELQIVPSSFNCEHGGSKLLHCISNPHYFLKIAVRTKPKIYIRTGQCGYALILPVFHRVFC